MLFSLTRKTFSCFLSHAEYAECAEIHTRYRLCILRDENIRQSWPTGVSAANALRVFRAFRVRQKHFA